MPHFKNIGVLPINAGGHKVVGTNSDTGEQLDLHLVYLADSQKKAQIISNALYVLQGAGKIIIKG